jgi:4-phytase/acid phosphatase
MILPANGTAPARASIETPVTLGADFAENLLLEYTEGFPMAQVGWGRVTRADIDQLMEMNTRYHDFIARTPESAQMVASNLAAHIRDTVLSAASENASLDRLGKPQDHFVLLVAHDGNISALGGLLRMEWLLPDQTFDATPPGSAIVFEVHKNRATGAKTIQAMFISQTLDQMRYLHPLQGIEQPSVAPIFIHGCSGPAPTYACSIEEFGKVVTASINAGFVTRATPNE